MAYCKKIRMKRRLLGWLVVIGRICFFVLPLKAQPGFKIFLVGDAGNLTEPGETLNALGKALNENPRSAVLFLGDNSYRNVIWGLIAVGFKGFDSSQNTIEKVRSQLVILDNYKGHVFFVPGNHDWWNRTNYKKGKPKLAMEQSFIEKNLSANKNIANPENTFIPRNGESGPDYVELNNDSIRIIFIDTYRIIQTGYKKKKLPKEVLPFFKRLDSVIAEGYRKHQQVIVAAHHPVYSVGPLNNHLSHPYLFGRIKTSFMDFPAYREMAGKIDTILHKYPGIYYVSGHLHALQYIYTKDKVRYIISGAGSKENRISENQIKVYNHQLRPAIDYLLMEWNSGGFFELDFTGPGEKTFMYYDNAHKKCYIP